MFGCFHNCVFVKINKEYPLQARRVMYSIWGAGQMAWTKMIVVVDDDVDVHDEESVLAAMFRNCHFARDVEYANGPLDILDHAAPNLAAGEKIGFDATRRMDGEDVNGIPVTEPINACDIEMVRANAHALIGRARISGVSVPSFGVGRCVFLAVEKQAAGDGRSAIEAGWDSFEAGGDMVVAVDASVDVANWEDVWFHVGANADPGRDRLQQGHRLGIDATPKVPGDERGGRAVRDFPPILRMDADITDKVTACAADFGLVAE
jgi:4-hydroxy-3-polyprenylbenzoate decarboxylase